MIYPRFEEAHNLVFVLLRLLDSHIRWTLNTEIYREFNLIHKPF